MPEQRAEPGRGRLGARCPAGDPALQDVPVARPLPDRVPGQRGAPAGTAIGVDREVAEQQPGQVVSVALGRGRELPEQDVVQRGPQDQVHGGEALGPVVGGQQFLHRFPGRLPGLVPLPGDPFGAADG